MLDRIHLKYGFNSKIGVIGIIFNYSKVVEFHPFNIKSAVYDFIDYEKKILSRNDRIMIKKNLISLKQALDMLYS